MATSCSGSPRRTWHSPAGTESKRTATAYGQGYAFGQGSQNPLKDSHFTSVFNQSERPAASINCGYFKSSLPIGGRSLGAASTTWVCCRRPISTSRCGGCRPPGPSGPRQPGQRLGLEVEGKCVLPRSRRPQLARPKTDEAWSMETLARRHPKQANGVISSRMQPSPAWRRSNQAPKRSSTRAGCGSWRQLGT